MLQDAHSARCFHPIRVCRCWAVAEDGRVGWVFVASWQEQECYPLTTGGDRPTAAQPSYYEVIHPTLQLLLPVFTPTPRGSSRLPCLRGEPHQDIDLPACSWTGLLPWRQQLRAAHVMWVRIRALRGHEGGAEEHCTALPGLCSWACSKRGAFGQKQNPPSVNSLAIDTQHTSSLLPAVPPFLPCGCERDAVCQKGLLQQGSGPGLPITWHHCGSASASTQASPDRIPCQMASSPGWRLL